MVSFYYKVGYVETKNPWYLPKFDSIKEFLTILVKDEELKVFKIFLHGQILYNWNSWSVDLFMQYDGWQYNLDYVFLERMMAKVYKIAFEKRLLVDITFCGNHQYSDQYQSAKSRGFSYPNFNNSQFIKFNHVVKTVDGESSERFLSSVYNTTAVTDYLVLYSNQNGKYSETVINKYSIEKYIFKEGISIDFFISLSQTQFEQTKKNQDWGINLNSNTVLNVAATSSLPINLPSFNNGAFGATGP